jgi:hypothetical protein
VITAPGRDRLYVRHAAAAELGAWSMERDIRWDAIDRDRALEHLDLLACLRDAAIVESYHPVNIAHLLQLASRDVDAGALLSLELYDGFKHFHCLRTYLEIVGYEPAITDDDILAARRGAIDESARPGELVERLVNFMLSEHLASYFFRRLGEQATEPILAEMLSLIAADEARHAQGTSDLLAQQIARDPAVVRAVLDAAAGFRHFGESAVAMVPVAQPGDPLAIRTFCGRIEQLCGVRLVDHIKATL